MLIDESIEVVVAGPEGPEDAQSLGEGFGAQGERELPRLDASALDDRSQGRAAIQAAQCCTERLGGRGKLRQHLWGGAIDFVGGEMPTTITRHVKKKGNIAPINNPTNTTGSIK